MTGPLLSFYGDDFTGSTDALEAIASRGVPSVLFPDPPDENLLKRFADCRAIGIAGESRSRTPAWMDENLPGIFAGLQRYGAPLCQYKVCSTFDSSPEIGNIGHAIEIGRQTFGSPWVPVAVAAPHLKRYVLFGNLFADAAGAVDRIDRHPMSRHPVTPMPEGDLRLHLARQTDLGIASVDIVALESGAAEAQLDRILARKPGAVLFDGLLEDSIREVGRLVWERASPGFCVGSSGLTQGLMLHWREMGLIPAHVRPQSVRPADRIIVVSGSCSVVTEGQIRRAMEHGYVCLPIGHAGQAREALQQGRSVVLYSALGPSDCDGPARGEALGRYLGELLLDLIRSAGVRRAIIAGGDTSSYAVRQLGVQALTFAGSLSPGAPLCRAHSGDHAIDGLELVLKGGQMGPENFFDIVRKGTA